jgi:hypothetical protein
MGRTVPIERVTLRMTPFSFSFPTKLLLAIVLLGAAALWSDEEWFVDTNKKNRSTTTNSNLPMPHYSYSYPLTPWDNKDKGKRKELRVTVEVGSPWDEIAPRINVKQLPSWLLDYIEFHREALEALKKRDNNSTSASSISLKEKKNPLHRYKYMIYTCKQGHHCSGTGNRQRGIMATFLVAVLTKRIFLMDIDNPVPLDRILEPHLISWNAAAPSLGNESTFLDVRNVQPNPLQIPSTFSEIPRVLRVLANGPGGLETIWKSPEMQHLLYTHGGVEGKNQGINSTQPLPACIYKWIFYTLFSPSSALSSLVKKEQASLGLSSNVTQQYIGIHVRLGGGGAWHGTREARYNGTAALPRFLQLGQELQHQTKNVGATTRRHDAISDVPLVIISDDERAKQLLFKMDPRSVRYVSNATLVHVDRSKEDATHLLLRGSLQVWADVLLLAQATCLVESLSSFSSLARRISMQEEEQQRCFARQEEGMLLQWKQYWKR